MEIHMGRKQRVQLSLSEDVTDRLDQEDNMSAKVERLLREDYDL